MVVFILVLLVLSLRGIIIKSMAMKIQGFTWGMIKNLSILISHMWYSNTFAIGGWKWCLVSITKPLRKMEEDVNGFQVLPSQVKSVRHIFEKHPDIAVEFRAKNQHLKKACMNFLLSLIETLCQSLQELSTEDLVEADIALTYLKDAGFKVDLLEKKLDQVKANKEKEKFGLARLQELEDNLLKLKQKCSELDALVEKEEAELSVTRTPLSFDDVV